jgi:alpha-D-ribose 1-methylphosphonate 5-triphosphate synthase subunit PhnL
MQPLLEIKHLNKSFTMHILQGKKIEALLDVNFIVNEGEIIGLTGKSGSGKSSLMKCIYRTYLSDGGQINYHANEGIVDLVTANDYEIIYLRKKEINYCSQFLSVIPRVTALRVVAQPLLKKGYDANIAIEKAKIILNTLGLPEALWSGFPVTFSGGEQQRINVARAIIDPPKLLLIDEPTASLDPNTKDIVIELLLALKKQGTTIICISHDDYTLDHLVNRRIHLEKGIIIN